MRKRNTLTKKYIRKPEKFADLCNFVLFGGKSVVLPENLAEKDVTELSIPFGEKGSKAVEKIRDLLKSCSIKTADGITYLIIGVENQTDIHYAMAVRCMVQDALNYASQVETLAVKHRKNKDLRDAEFLSGMSKEDKLVPVVTITVFWNAGQWDGPRSLHEMLDVEDEELLKFVPDYRLNLVIPEEISDFSRFSTELGPVLKFWQCSNDKEKMREWLDSRTEALMLDYDSVQLLNECLNAGIKLPEEGEKIDMCKGLDGLIEEGRAEGERRGIAVGEVRGAERMSRLMGELLGRNMIEEAKEAAANEVVREKYYALYNI